MIRDIEIENQILNPLFDNKFDIINFQNFLKETLPDIELKNEPKNIKKEYMSFIDSAHDFGLYKGNETNSSKYLKVFVVKLKKSTSVINARTMQRNLIANFLKKGRVSSALVVFHDDFSNQWRLSFVKVHKELIRDENNNLRTKIKPSPPKRFSFLVGSEKNHTCKSRFLNLIKKSKPKLKDIENVFNVETVTEEFFEDYKKLYLKLKDSLDEIRENDSIVDDDLKNNNIKSSDFAKKLMGQLVFIYFLQKKGLMGVKKDSNWGTGSKNFLRTIFNDCVDNGKNFFNDILEHLFYEGFSVDESDYHYEKFGYKIPFINGGLFEPIKGYNWKLTNIVLDNSIFEEIINTFDKFNFTVKEDEPLEKEVAVDPEMLGKVFESLLEENEQKDKGAYYTPRYIVHYICQESLIKYLSTKSEISEEDLRIFILDGDIHIDSIIKNHEEMKEYKGKSYTRITLPDSINENSEELNILLSKVKVIDPAVGSGAFPVAMMNEIIKARHILLLLNNVEDINFYDLKKETIENSLYGVDKELSATDITKLRFWLSLIVDEEIIDFVNPLPNLDNKIMCGNSLVDSFDDVKLFNNSLIMKSSQTNFAVTDTEKAFNDLESKKREYFKTSNFNSKKMLKDEINKLKWKFFETHLNDLRKEDILPNIKNYEYREDKPFFIWELEFSEVFRGENPGFDIVVGNPPYGAKLTKKEKEYLNENYIQGGSETVVSFIKLSYDKLLKKNAVLGFIIPKSFTYASNYISIREYILDNIETVIDCGKVWKKVKLEQVILFINKSQKFDYYNSGTRVDEVLPIDSKVSKDYYDEFQMILNGVNDKEIYLAKKILKSNSFLNDIIYNVRGGVKKEDLSINGTIPVLGGSVIHRDGIIGIMGKTDDKVIKNTEKYMVNKNTVLVQNILSHITKPKDHIKITACIPNSLDYAILETINQLFIKSKVNEYFVWILLNSKLINWYCYRFIYAKAIRTMHFDNPVTSKIPLPPFQDKKLLKLIENKSKELNENYQKAKAIKKEMFNCLRENSINKIQVNNKIQNFEKTNYKNFIKEINKQDVNIVNIENFEEFFINKKNSCLIINDKIYSLEKELNYLIYELYELKDEEIKIIEESFI